MTLAIRLTLLCAVATLFAFAPANSLAQEKESKPGEKSAEPAAAPPKEESSVTDHSIKIAGQSIPYKATVGSLLLILLPLNFLVVFLVNPPAFFRRRRPLGGIGPDDHCVTAHRFGLQTGKR